MKQNPTAQTDTQESFSLSRAKRWFVFISLCVLNSCVIISNGVISSAVLSIKNTFQISDNQLGLIGTCFSAGNLLGSFVFMSLINVFNRKWFLIFDFVIHCSSLLICSITSQFYIFLCCRTITGICLVNWFIYIMIWIDQFGVNKWKSWKMTLINLSGQVSMLWGYLLNLIIGATRWSLCFRIEVILVGFILFLLAFVDNVYFAQNLFAKPKKDKEIQEKHESRLDSLFYYQGKTSVIVEEKTGIDVEAKENVKKTKKKDTIFTPLYIIMILAKSAQFFVMMTTMFWFTDYSQTALKVTDFNQIVSSFSIVMTFASIMGYILSAIVSTSIGGYESKNALLVCIILKGLATPFGAFIPFTDNFIYFSIALFGYNLFDQASILLSNSLILVSVSNELKGQANAVFSILSNVLAFLPSTVIYGYLKSKFGNINPKLPYGIIMYYGFSSLIFLLIGLFIQKMTHISTNDSQFEAKTSENEEILIKDIRNSNKA